MKARSQLLKRALEEKLIKLSTTPEQDSNIRYTDEILEVNQIPNKHPSDKEIKFVDICAIDAKTEQTTLKTAKFAAN